MKDLVEIVEYNDEGNAPVIDFESWRVARTNYSKQADKENIITLGRHYLTDEVFVLLEGKAVLIVASGQDEAKHIHCINIEKIKLYNVKKNVLHALVTAKDAKLCIVENRNTAIENSQVIKLRDDQIQYIKKEICKLF